MLMPPELGYPRARELLRNRFGDEIIIVDLWVRRLVGENRTVPLQEYADNLRSCFEALTAMNALTHLDNSTNLPKLVERLPGYLQSRWRGLALQLRKERPARRPALADLVEFVQDAALEANDPLYGIKPRKSAQPPVVRGASMMIADAHFAADADMDSDRDSQLDTSSEMDTGTTDSTKDTRKVPACAVCNGKHVATKCRTLRRLGPKDRIEKVRSLHLCFSCLKPGHGSYRCQERLRCKVQGCQRHHATLLHGSTWPSSTTSTDTSGAGQSHTRIVQAGASQETSTPPPSSPAVHSQGSEAQGQGVMCSGHVVESAVQKVALPTVAVKVKAPGSDSCVDTYALLDTGASRSFCTEGLFNALGIEGRTKPVAVSTLTGYTYDNATRIADLQVSGICGKESLLLSNVHARTVLPELMGHVGTKVDADRWPHLHGLPIPQARADQVGLIIGQDNSDALAPLSSIFGRRGEPYAVRTRLGWSLHGPLVPARRVEEPSASLVVADCGSSELAGRQAKVVKRDTQRTVRRDSAQRQRSSLSTGLERSSGRRSKRRGRKGSCVSASSAVSASLPVTKGQPTASSKTEPAKRPWFRGAARQRNVRSLYREHCINLMPLSNRNVSQNGDCIVRGRIAKSRQQQILQPK